MKIGILGDGQLGRMLKEAASVLGMEAYTFAHFHDETALRQFIHTVDVLTFEFENIPTHVFSYLEKKPVFPKPEILAITRDRLLEKKMLVDLGLQVAPFQEVRSLQDVRESPYFPCIIKTRQLGYDGKGQLRLENEKHFQDKKTAIEEIVTSPCIVEAVIPFACELSVIVGRGQGGEIACYDVTRTLHKNHILSETYTPAGLNEAVEKKAQSMAQQIVQALDYRGVMGVEMFYCAPDHIIVNELAPRVHNSGHWTQDACLISQFEQHIRAIVGLPLGNTHRHHAVKMINLLGEDINLAHEAFSQPNCHVHLYGKKEVRENRKMGHVNILFDSAAALGDTAGV